MKGYSAFLDILDDLSCSTGKRPDSQRLALALDGQASTQLRELISIGDRRSKGAFFTDSQRAEQLVERLTDDEIRSAFIVDPNCGAGNLLLAAARRLPVKRTPESTAADWGTRLGGIDIVPEFVEATKRRLWLLAVQRCRWLPTRQPNLDRLFPFVRVADALCESEVQSQADILLLNPPYGMVQSPKQCGWTTGSVCAAAVFVEHAIEISRRSASVAAILPDVLRSGARYRRWRDRIQSLASIRSVLIGGLFDEFTDVNVFSLYLKRGQPATDSIEWTPRAKHDGTTIGDHFDVRIGPVVPFRDKHQGAWRTYLTMSSLRPWTTVMAIHERRRFSGATYVGPFVAVCRVSRPDDAYRARATLIRVKVPVAVENHIVVCKPKDGTLSACRRLMASLKSDLTNSWLNSEIRCRHLTAQALRQLPLFE